MLRQPLRCLLRQPFIKSVKTAQFPVKNFSQPIPKVLQRSYGKFQIHVEPYTKHPKHDHATMRRSDFFLFFLIFMLIIMSNNSRRRR